VQRRALDCFVSAEKLVITLWRNLACLAGYRSGIEKRLSRMLAIIGQRKTAVDSRQRVF